MKTTSLLLFMQSPSMCFLSSPLWAQVETSLSLAATPLTPLPVSDGSREGQSPSLNLCLATPDLFLPTLSSPSNCFMLQSLLESIRASSILPPPPSLSSWSHCTVSSPALPVWSMLVCMCLYVCEHVAVPCWAYTCVGNCKFFRRVQSNMFSVGTRSVQSCCSVGYRFFKGWLGYLHCSLAVFGFNALWNVHRGFRPLPLLLS